MRLLKLFIAVAVLVVVGPTLLRYIAGGPESNSIEPRLRAVNHVPQGLPVDPDIAKQVDKEDNDVKPQALSQDLVRFSHKVRVTWCIPVGAMLSLWGIFHFDTVLIKSLHKSAIF